MATEFVSDWSRLPGDILALVAPLLGSDAAAARLACKPWFGGLTPPVDHLTVGRGYPPRWTSPLLTEARSLSVSSGGRFRFGDAPPLDAFRGLERLAVDLTDTDGAWTRLVRSLPRHGRVRDLVLSSASRLTHQQFHDVARLASLTRLELIDTPLLSDRWYAFGILSRLGGLTSLTVDTRSHDVEDEGMLALCGLTRLTSLTIHCEGTCHAQDGLLALRGLTGLTALRLRGAAMACGDAVLAVVSELSLLKTLDIQVSEDATSYGFASLTELELLQELHLRTHWANFGRIQIEIRDLSGFRALERVSLACSGCVLYALKAFARLPTLKHLDATFTPGVRRDINDLLSQYFRGHGSGDPALPLLSIHHSYDPHPQ
jgi:hypothetical protein